MRHAHRPGPRPVMDGRRWRRDDGIDIWCEPILSHIILISANVLFVPLPFTLIRVPVGLHSFLGLTAAVCLPL